MRRFEKSTDSEHAFMRLDGNEVRASSNGRFPLGERTLIVWLLVATVFFVAAALSLFTGMKVTDPAAADGELSRRSPVACGSVMSPTRWSEEKWAENAVEWRTRVCDNARISRLGWTGVFVIGGLFVLVTGLGVRTWQRSRSTRDASP